MVDPTGCQLAFEDEIDFVRRMLRRYGVAPADVEDLAQDVFLVMCRRWVEYQRDRPLRNWLLGITFKVAQGYRRRSGREVFGATPDCADASPQPDDQLSEVQRRSAVSKVFADLPERHRSILALHDLQELPVREIAARLSVPLFTAYGRLRSARQAFARALREAQVAPALIPVFWLGGGRHHHPAPPPSQAAAPDRQPTRWLPAAPRPGAIPAAAAGAALLGVVTLAMVLRPPAAADASPPIHQHGYPAATPPVLSLPPPVPARSTAETSGSAAAATDAVDLARGLLGYWPLDGEPGALVRDHSPSAGHCRLRGLPGAGDARASDTRAADMIDGARGKALSLAGRAWLECPASLLATVEGQLSVALWIRPGRPAAGIRALVSRQLGDGRQDQFFLGLDDHSIETSSHLWKGVISRPLPLALDRWVHIAVVHDQSLTRLFVGGIEIGSRPTRDVSLGGGSTPWLVGGAANGPDPDQVDERFEGAIDDLYLYSRALSEAEVQALAAGRPPR